MMARQYSDGGTIEDAGFGVEMSSLAQTVRKRRSSKKQPPNAREALPDIAEAEAVLLDLARVFSDPAMKPLSDLNPFTVNGEEAAADARAPNAEAKYRALLEQIP